MTHSDVDADPSRIDTSFDVLRNPSRRALCRYVMRTEADTVTPGTLVDYIADRAPDTADRDLERRNLATELRHVHLPKLADTGLIEYDRRDEVVRVDRSAVADRLEAVHATVVDLQDGESVTDR
ncbi:DUF7344 domain-containing protein [Natronorubrum sp. FCH18a]|uniref:DUF7344 domain-containing protein n=1 Tax=Natronorubrum sp. FCH18a TaxID=3447018 RepID=UPI003F510B7D